MSALSRRILPLLDRVLVEKIVPKKTTPAGVLLPESATAKALNEGKVVAVGPGSYTREGQVLPVSCKVGDTVLLPEFGGTQIKLDGKDFMIYRDDEILAKLE
ncbi:mitochondrial chaperonin hsp10, precursor [Cyanidioschyzon merolae strain 10D]|jgi:chaperonin GroES|uniref:Mitochondrial chaperonin hsp10 n=1 Tax=Cyanidioschyzon merolae (strain NIES-3377 / 10D) TaxID=280699 RepID=M1VB71_CYAM1|nr:mitochondrial chaperonin hsp10, precursor [Cyanidioschyzon merolae strain 10D]BAM79497.1 mitochondrial chaperonin hsp10, precursor [Cyanidioschyzon merolae strain 10D]|eukprot:XP_005535783.1 mitochondrial chaperonin hsp10, precursor [Cyanidioschyzon merolae strain 10D]